MSDYEQPEHDCTVVAGDGDATIAADVISAHTNRLELLPAQVGDKLKSAGWEVEEDPDNSDYVYAVAEMASLVGSRYARLRQHLRRFEKWAGRRPITLREGNPVDDALTIVNLADVWGQAQDQSAAVHQLETLNHLLGFAPQLRERLWVHVLEVEAIPVAFALSGRDNDWIHVHFQLHKQSIPGASRALTHLLSARMAIEGVRWMNYQQDLGIPGLREYKEGLRPAMKLPKNSARRSTRLCEKG